MHIFNKATLALACMCGGLALAPANAQPKQPPEPAEMNSPQEMWLNDMCTDNHGGNGFAEMMQGRAEHMATMLQLNPQQVAALKDIGDSRMKEAKDFKASICAHKPDLASFAGRIAFRVQMMQHRLDTFKDEAAKLTSFYNSLDDKQKSAFEEMGMGEMMGHEHGDMNEPMEE